MKIEESSDGEILIDCMECTMMYQVPDFRALEHSAWVCEFYERCRTCPDCEAASKAENAKYFEQKKQADCIANLPTMIRKANIPEYYIHDREEGELFKVPPVRFVAEWIWKHRNENLLISGETGTGKSTSACFIAVKMILDEKHVIYTSLRKILAEWREAKISDNYASKNLLHSIFSQHIVIIDEFVGKAKVSESGQELLFELFEAVNCGDCKARIWLLGNFYAGSIEELFNDPEPVRRRLQENFTCVSIDANARKINPVQVWK